MNKLETNFTNFIYILLDVFMIPLPFNLKGIIEIILL